MTIFYFVVDVLIMCFPKAVAGGLVAGCSHWHWDRCLFLLLIIVMLDSRRSVGIFGRVCKSAHHAPFRSVYVVFTVYSRYCTWLEIKFLPPLNFPHTENFNTKNMLTPETQTNMRTSQIAYKPDRIKKVCGNFLIWFTGIPI